MSTSQRVAVAFTVWRYFSPLFRWCLAYPCQRSLPITLQTASRTNTRS